MVYRFSNKFSSENVDEKFFFIMEYKDYGIACVCITTICILYRARDIGFYISALVP